MLSLRRIGPAVLCSTMLAAVVFSSEDTATEGEISDLIHRAAAFRKASQLDSAVTLARLAYQLSDGCAECHDTTRVMAMNALSWSHQLQGHYDSALAYSNRALTLRCSIDSTEDSLLVATLSNKAGIQFGMKEYDSAIAIFEYLLDVNKRTQDSSNPIIAKTILNLGTIYYFAERHEQALPYLLEALRLIKQQVGTENKDYIIALSNIATVYRQLGKLDESETCQLEALAVRRRLFGDDNIEVAKGLLNLSNLYIDQGRHAEAQPLSSEALELFRRLKGQTHEYTYAAMLNLGEIDIRQGRYERAEREYLDALEIARSLFGEHSPDVATALQRLATVYRHQGRFSETVPPLDNALRILTDHFGESNTKVAAVLSQLSVSYRLLGNIAKAESLQLKALRMREAVLGANSIDVATDLTRLADIYLTMGDCTKALGLQERAKGIFESVLGADNPQTAESKKELADICCRLGEYSRAQALSDEALLAFHSLVGEVQPSVAATLKVQGDIQYGQGQYGAAENLYSRAYEILANYLGDSHPSLGELELSLGRSFTHLGRFAEARDIFSRFVSNRRSFLEYAFPLSSEDQKLDISRRFPILNSDIINLALSSHDPETNSLALNMVISGKGSVISAIKEERSAAVCSVDDHLTRTLEQHAEVRSTIASLAYAGMFDDGANFAADSLQLLYGMQDSLEVVLAQACGELGTGLRATSCGVENIQRILANDELLIEYVRHQVADESGSCTEKREPTDTNYAALALTRTGAGTVIDLGSSHPIDSLIFEVRQLMAQPSSDLYTPLAADVVRRLNELSNRLYHQILAPVVVRYENCRKIVVSPDGPIHLVPFGIMADDHDKFLAESYTFSYVASSRDLLQRGDFKPTDSTALVISNPDYNLRLSPTEPAADGNGVVKFAVSRGDGGQLSGCLSGSFSDLQYGDAELRSVNRILGQNAHLTVRQWSDRGASESLFKHLPTPPSVLHMITHGFYCPDLFRSEHPGSINPLLKSGLALAGANTALKGSGTTNVTAVSDDGILTAFEVSTLNLVGTDLVTLSACESGMGQTVDGEGVFGLRCAFQSAGARSLLMSLWKIPDRETARLMEYFYTFWIGGDSKSTALHKAELRMIDDLKSEIGCAPPFLWGGFVLTGNPD